MAWLFIRRGILQLCFPCLALMWFKAGCEHNHTGFGKLNRLSGNPSPLKAILFADFFYLLLLLFDGSIKKVLVWCQTVGSELHKKKSLFDMWDSLYSIVIPNQVAKLDLFCFRSMHMVIQSWTQFRFHHLKNYIKLITIRGKQLFQDLYKMRVTFAHAEQFFEPN